MSGRQQQRLSPAESPEEAPGPALRPASPHLRGSCRGQGAPCEGRDPWVTGPGPPGDRANLGVEEARTC